MPQRIPTPSTRLRATLLLVLLCVVAATRFARGQAEEPEMLSSGADQDRVQAIAQAIGEGTPYVPGELLVRFRQGAGTTQQLSALNAIRVPAALDQARWLGDTLLVSGVAEADVEHAANLLAAQPAVVYAQPNYIRRLHSVPNDPLYGRQWNLDQINMPAAWDINKGAGAGVTVAVLDSGWTSDDATYGFRVPLSPTSFAVFAVPLLRPPDFDYSRVLSGVEFTHTGPWLNAARKPVVFDAEGHGTHVAGTIAQQTNNGLAFAGVANGATLMPVKVCEAYMDWVLAWGRDLAPPPTLDGVCIDSDVIAGMRYAVDNGARVVNVSLGGPQADPALLDTLNYAVSRGAFVAISAGNDAENGNPTEYPAAYPRDIQGVVAVGATSARKTRATYSNFGSYVELAAPGGDCTDEGEVVWQVGPDQNDLDAIPPRFDRYFQKPDCGTSMAAPHVAGAAALLYSQGITNPAAVEAALERFAEDLGTPGRDVDFGFGLIDVRAALRGLRLAR